jgi:hypothetical protein
VSRHEIGSTVLAIRDSNRDTVYIYGEGVYVGDRPMPGTPDDHVPLSDYDVISSVLVEDDMVPVEEHRFLVWYDEWVAQGVKVLRTRAEVIAGIETDRAKPMGERVRKLYLDSRMNPCIYLDSGDVVYGFQCWWGPAKQAHDRFALIEKVVVPVPAGNGRWRI